MSSGIFSCSTDPKDDLESRLINFIHLYSQRRDDLQKASEGLSLTAAQLQDKHKDSSGVQVLCVITGGFLGAGFGGVTGGVGGAFGAVAASTWARIFDHINAAETTVGFVGSVLGGVFGGAFSGAIGGAVSAGVKASDSPDKGKVRNVVWLTIGLATGGAIGGIFGGRVGAKGGAVGGAFGVLCATGFAGGVVGIVNYLRSSNLEEEKSTKEQMLRKTAHFCETFKLLVTELNSIKTISDKMATSAGAQGVAEQSAKTLTSVKLMLKTLSDSLPITDLPRFISSAEELARHSKRITEELAQMNKEGEKMLVSLMTH
ncbi:hypothetical protein PBY51_002070 [Eleginops maclovinus]|uniref:Uncharacterized protein n=2 Tax=Eleginops maclovinus TaxID=56733 RepID=A0AAN7WZ95_ELEMC|nr:hypothetical protein PBY51_002070 [Eleginops maclovinus]